MPRLSEFPRIASQPLVDAQRALQIAQRAREISGVLGDQAQVVVGHGLALVALDPAERREGALEVIARRAEVPEPREGHAHGQLEMADFLIFVGVPQQDVGLAAGFQGLGIVRAQVERDGLAAEDLAQLEPGGDAPQRLFSARESGQRGAVLSVEPVGVCDLQQQPHAVRGAGTLAQAQEGLAIIGNGVAEIGSGEVHVTDGFRLGARDLKRRRTRHARRLVFQVSRWGHSIPDGMGSWGTPCYRAV